jgi:YVTN family beta-propeller protein
MWDKQNTTWDRIENHYDTNVFKSILDKLKTYSKCVNASAYNTTRTLSDVYGNLKYQNALWVQTTNFAESDIELMGFTIERGKFYNLLKHFSCKELSDSVEFRTLLEDGILRASNALLFEDILNPTRKDWFCAYEPKKINQYINRPFDYLVVRYKLKDPVSRDIDTRTAIVDTGYSGDYLENGSLVQPSLGGDLIDGNDIGYARGTTIANTSGVAYLDWGGDNTTSTGGEAILIDFFQISEDLNYLDTISIRLRAFFYAVIGNGQIEMELATYIGGNMVKDIPNRDFINVGGNLVQSVTVDRQILTQISSGLEDGDELGTVVYNTSNSNAIITDTTHDVIANNNLSFTDLVNQIDFKAYTWQMGTSGFTVNDPNYTDMLVDHTFKCEDIEKVYQDSYEQYGYAQKNVFTSNKVWEKLLTNFHVIDIASTTHIDLLNIDSTPISYPILDIDGVRLVPEHRILLKNQDSSKDNGIYVYDGNTLVRDEIFKTDEDLEYFSVFIKEGIENKNKEYFLERKESGQYPSFEEDSDCECKCDCLDEIICDKFVFTEGENYVLRNRASYKLLADHTFTDANYFTQLEPITNVDYSERMFVTSSTAGTYYLVGDEFNTLEFYSNFNLFNSGRVGLQSTDTVNVRIESLPTDDLYLLRNKNEVVNFVSFTDGNTDIFNSVLNLPFNAIDFQLNNSTSGYFLSEGDNILHSVNFDINGDILSDVEINLENNSTEIRIINNYNFYLTVDGLYLNLNGENYKLNRLNLPNTLRVEQNGSNFNVSYLIDDSPNTIQITEDELLSLLSWDKEEDYEIRFFDKKEINEWEVVGSESTSNLYLKDVKITNTSDLASIPKISGESARLFDGIDDYTDLNNNEVINQSITDLKNSNGSFTVEFKVKPNNIRVKQPTFYFGNESELVTYKSGSDVFTLKLPPREYITFYLDSGDDFPVFIISNGIKTLEIKSNKKININEETHVSFVWNYTTNKSSGTLYFNGKSVGQFVDQQIGTNIPIDIRTFSFDKNYFGKTEFESNPLYEGYLSDFRLWDRVFNSAQIVTRIDKNITPANENFYPNLKGYWKLDDSIALQKNLIYDFDPLNPNSIGSGLFNGGLNNDENLQIIQSPQLIQLSDDYLYVLDKKYTEILESPLDGSDSTSFWSTDYSPDVVVDSEGTNSLRLFGGDSGYFVEVSNVNIGDSITIEVDSYYEYLNNSGTGGSIITTYLENNSTSFIETENIIPNVWNKLTQTVLFNGTSSISDVLVNLSNINSNNEKTLFKNFVLKINRTANPINDIYKISLTEERVEHIYNTVNQIDSIYLEDETQKFFFLENNTVFEKPDTDDITVSPNNTYQHTASTAIDFAYINNVPYMLDDSGDIYDDNIQVYTGVTNVETIYGFEDSNISKTVLYWKELDDSINVLSRDDSNTTVLEYKAKYPFIDNSKLTVNAFEGTAFVVNNYVISDNKLLLNGVDLDPLNKDWAFNLKDIWGVYKRVNDDRVIVGVRTISNEVQLWLYDNVEKSKIKFTNFNNDATLFNNESFIDLTTFYVDGVEWVVITNVNEIRFYQIEKDNKVDYKKVNYNLPINSDRNITEIQFNKKDELWLTLSDGTLEYVSNLTSINTDYDLFENIMEYTKSEDGWLIGESGILFVDSSTSSSSFSLEFNNIVFKDDFNDLEVVKSKVNRDLGYKVTEWSGIAWAVGDMGRMIRTYNNGANWTVLDTKVFHKLTSASFINETDGLIVGLNGTILATFSGGDSFVTVNIPESIGLRDWHEVLYYDIDKAIIVGNSGTILHLRREKFQWNIDRILNKIELAELDIQIKQKDLSDSIELKIQKEIDSDLYIQTLRNVEYLGNKEFLIVGDNDLVCHLRLVEQIGYIEPYLNFFKTNLNVDWNDVVSYDDIVVNQKRAFLLADKEIYSIEWDRFNLADDVNIEDIDSNLYATSEETIRTLELTNDNNNLIYAGERVEVCNDVIFEENGTSGIFQYSENVTCLDLSENFLPRMLFLDYYMGRKINIHLEDNDFVKPIGKLDKSKLDCFYFTDSEYIEFTDYGTVDNQNNYLAYQDHYYLNRRLLDVPNSWGKIQPPYNKYNKRITALDDYDNKAVWKGIPSEEVGYNFLNEAVTDLTTFQNGDLREDSNITKLRLGLNDSTQYIQTGVITNRISKTSETLLDNGLYETQIRVSDNTLFTVGGYVKLDYTDKPFKIVDIPNTVGFKYLVIEGDQIPITNVSGTVEEVLISVLDNLEIGDVINLTVIDSDTSKVLEEGDKLYYQLLTEALDINEVVTVEEKNINEYKLVFKDFEIAFAKGVTTRDIYFNFLIGENSPVLQVANQLLDRRCYQIFEEQFRLFDEEIDSYVSSSNNFDYLLIEEMNKLIIATDSPNRVQIFNTETNILEANIVVESGSQNLVYSPKYKKVYVSGGTLADTKVDVINMLDNTLETSIDLGITGQKMIYNPLNKYIHVATNSNQYIVIDNISIVDTIDVIVKDHVYVEDKEEIYVITNTNDIKIIKNTIVDGTITVGAVPSLEYISYNGGQYIYTASVSDNKVYVIDVDTNSVATSVLITEGLGTQYGFKQISYSTVNRLYISNYNGVSNTKITIFDTDSNSIEKTIDVGIFVKDIVYNEEDGYIYLGGENGEIKLIKTVDDDGFPLEILETGIDPYTLPSGSVYKMAYNNGNVYPLISSGQHLMSVVAGKFIPTNIGVELNNLITSNTTVVRDIEISNSEITIWDLWKDEMVYESNLNTSKLIFRNLNYFNKDLLQLQEVFEKHYLGQSYDLIINEEDYLIIEGSVNDLTKYYNLESYVTYATFPKSGTGGTAGTSGISLDLETIAVEYDSDVVYGPNYSLLSFLKNLDPITFTYNYEFDTKLMPSESFTYQPLTRTASGDFVEFRIEKNRIYIGTEYATQIEKFLQGTFIDITNGNKSVTRVYIKEFRTEQYDKYPENTRYVLITDKQLEDNLNLTGVVTLRTRNKLGEVSMDLEFTDDIMFPISNNGSNAVGQFNRRYYNNAVTSYQYARILSNDDNIRNEVSSIIHLDEDSDWILNVVDWKSDPNFYYRPLDLHEVGVDRVFKKGISVDASNYLINGEVLELVDIDLNKFNFRIVDGMTLKELEEDYYWVLNADIRNAIVGRGSNGEFVWYQGDWLCGTWENGVWYSGQAFEIEWVTGDVYSNKVVNNFNLISTVDDGDSSNTIWFNAVWGSGNWYNGTWNNGTWNKGSRFKGVWNNGTWKGGIWESGEFNGGIWLDGTWLNGSFSQGNTFSIWHSGTWLGGDFENGTWLNGIFDQTDRVASRFGTKASLLNPAIWEYGLWKNGEFHSGLTLDSNGNTIASANYSNSTWYNGTWKKGTFYGGIWKLGVWENGVWENGYWKSNLDISEIRVRFGNDLIVGSDIEVEFTTPHYYKDLVINSETNTLQQNYFVILGKPDIVDGQISSNSEFFGHNTNVKRHIIKEILDEKTVLINIDGELEDTISNNIGGSQNKETDDKLTHTPLPNFVDSNVAYYIYSKVNNSFYVYLDTGKWHQIDAETTNDVINTTLNTYQTPVYNNYNDYIYFLSNIFFNPNVTLTPYDPVTDTILTPVVVGNDGFSYQAHDIMDDGKIVVLFDGQIKIMNTANGNSISNVLLGDIYDSLVLYGDKILVYNSSGEIALYDNQLNLIFATDLNVNSVSSTAYDTKANHVIVCTINTITQTFTVFTLDASNGNIINTVSGHIGGSYDAMKYIKELDTVYLYKSGNGRVSTMKNGEFINLDALISDPSVFQSTYITDIFYYTKNKTMYLVDSYGYFIPCRLDGVDLYAMYGDITKIGMNTNLIEFADGGKKDSIWSISYDPHTSQIEHKLNFHKFSFDCSDCVDYAVDPIIVEDSEQFDIEAYYITDSFKIASHWRDGKYNRGIWDYGYFNNGTWTGGIWIDGVFENGIFGTE